MPVARSPWETNEERLTSDALDRALAPASVIRRWQPANLFPPRTGFDREVPTIEDVLNIDRVYSVQMNRRGAISGTPVRVQTTDDSWSGSSRYSMRSLGW